MFTHPHPVSSASPSEPQKTRYAVARVDEYPALFLKSFRVVRTLSETFRNITDIYDSFGRHVSYSVPCSGVRSGGGERLA